MYSIYINKIGRTPDEMTSRMHKMLQEESDKNEDILQHNIIDRVRTCFGNWLLLLQPLRVKKLKIGITKNKRYVNSGYRTPVEFDTHNDKWPPGKVCKIFKKTFIVFCFQNFQIL